MPGLFACGDACDSNRCVHGAVTGGYAAGNSAAAHAVQTAGGLPDGDAVAREKERAFAPLLRREGMSFRDFENIIRKIMTEHVGAERNETGLQLALRKLARAKIYAAGVKAQDFHELMRVHEANNLLQIAEITGV